MLEVTSAQETPRYRGRGFRGYHRAPSGMRHRQADVTPVGETERICSCDALTTAHATFLDVATDSKGKTVCQITSLGRRQGCDKSADADMRVERRDYSQECDETAREANDGRDDTRNTILGRDVVVALRALGENCRRTR